MVIIELKNHNIVLTRSEMSQVIFPTHVTFNYNKLLNTIKYPNVLQILLLNFFMFILRKNFVHLLEEKKQLEEN